MADLRFVVEAEDPLPLDLVLKTLTDARSILMDVERGVSRSDRSVGEIVVSHVADRSVAIDLHYRARTDADQAVVARAESAFVEGLASISNAAIPPRFFGSESLHALRRMSRRLQRVRGGRLGISDGGGTSHASIDASTLESVERLLSGGHDALGSIIGRLEAVNIHHRRVARVYSEDWTGSVECHFDESSMAEVRAALGSRVVATGVIQRTATGSPTRLTLTELEILPDANELPTIDDLIGIDPDFAGGLSGEDYVSQQRR